MIRVIEKRPHGIVVSANTITEVRAYAKKKQNLDENSVISLSRSMSPRRRRTLWGTSKSVYLVDKK